MISYIQVSIIILLWYQSMLERKLWCAYQWLMKPRIPILCKMY